MRIDGRTTNPDITAPPPAWTTTDLVTDCLRHVLATIAAEAPDPHQPTAPVATIPIRWGEQHDIRPISLDGSTSTGKVANYLAKYLTKSVHSGGTLDRPVRSPVYLARLLIPAHTRRLVETCWQLGAHADFATALDTAARRQPGPTPGLIRWSHTLGYGGHWLSKSHRYSTTFGALRTARRDHARVTAAVLAGNPLTDAFGRPPGDPATAIQGAWRYAGRGEASAERNVGAAPPGGSPSDPDLARAGGSR